MGENVAKTSIIIFRAYDKSHRSILRGKDFIKMIENILIGVFSVIILGGAVAAWWIENGPEKKDKNEGD